MCDEYAADQDAWRRDWGYDIARDAQPLYQKVPDKERALAYMEGTQGISIHLEQLEKAFLHKFHMIFPPMNEDS